MHLLEMQCLVVLVDLEDLVGPVAPVFLADEASFKSHLRSWFKEEEDEEVVVDLVGPCVKALEEEVLEEDLLHLADLPPLLLPLVALLWPLAALLHLAVLVAHHLRQISG